MFYAQRDVEDHRSRLQAQARDAYRARVDARKAQRAEAAARKPPEPRPEATVPEAPPSPAVTEPPKAVPGAVAQRKESPPQPATPAAAPPAEPAAIPSPGTEGATEPPGRAAPPPSAQPVAPAKAPQLEPSQVTRATVEQQAPGLSPMEELRARRAPPAEAPAAAAEAPAQVPAPQVAKPVAPPAASATDDPALARYVREIRKVGTRVLEESQYPNAASGKGWSGTAQIDVHFASGGFIRSILLGESCGHQALDARALDLARGILFPHRPPALYPREFTVRFPITFKPRKAR
jgi:TonB family protein